MRSWVGRETLALAGASAVTEAANLRGTVTGLATQWMKLTTQVMSIVTGTARDAAAFVSFSTAVEKLPLEVVKLQLEARGARFAVVKLLL
jgi:hypothetical protein